MLVKLLSNSAKLPTRTYPTDAGLDLYSPVDVKLYRINNHYHTGIKIPIDIAIALDPGTVAYIMPRSSMNARGIFTATGVIDANYRGNIMVWLANMAGEFVEYIKAGDKIAQLVIHQVNTPIITQVDTLDTTDRGSNGFGSSGR